MHNRCKFQEIDSRNDFGKDVYRSGCPSPNSCPDETFSLEESSTGRGPCPGRRRERTVQRTADPSAQPAETRSSSKPPVTRIGQLRPKLKGYRLRPGACSMTARP